MTGEQRKSLEKFLLKTKLELMIRRKQLVEEFKTEVAISNIIHAIDAALLLVGDDNGNSD